MSTANRKSNLCKENVKRSLNVLVPSFPVLALSVMFCSKNMFASANNRFQIALGMQMLEIVLEMANISGEGLFVCALIIWQGIRRRCS